MTVIMLLGPLSILTLRHRSAVCPPCKDGAFLNQCHVVLRICPRIQCFVLLTPHLHLCLNCHVWVLTFGCFELWGCCSLKKERKGNTVSEQKFFVTLIFYSLAVTVYSTNQLQWHNLWNYV